MNDAIVRKAKSQDASRSDRVGRNTRTESGKANLGRRRSVDGKTEWAQVTNDNPQDSSGNAMVCASPKGFTGILRIMISGA